MRKFLLVLGIMALICSPAIAGKNAGGALVCHTDGVTTWTIFDDYCGADYDDPGTCLDANTQSNVDGNVDAAVIWLLAAFPPGSSPGVSVVFFGIEHNIPAGFFAEATFCGPAGTLQIPDAGWPDDWANAGNSVAFGTPVVGQQLFMFYYLATWGVPGNFLGTGINPTGGYAAFVSDDVPGVQDDVILFGQVRWGEPGANECPQPAQPEACCFVDGSCIFVLADECLDLGGAPQGAGTDCDPNDCPQPLGACCFEDGACVMMEEVLCFDQGGTLWLPDDVCEPNPCPQPPAVCCFDDGACLVLEEDQCIADGGTFRPDLGDTCEPDNPCPPPPPVWACCFEDGTCEDLTQAECDAAGGISWEEGFVCADDPCPPVATEDATWGQIKSSYK